MYQGIGYDLGAPIAAVIAAGLMTSVVSFNVRTNTVDAAGQVDLSDWTPVTGLQNIPCMFSQSRINPTQGGVKRAAPVWGQLSEFRLLLNGYYPGILAQYQAVVNGTAYEVMSYAESDSQQTMTHVALRVYSE
jgi:hypothetical protein